MTRLAPEFLTHNYDPGRGPFRNVCTLSVPEAQRVLDEIRDSGKRRIKSNYLKRRLDTEHWLLIERTRKLGPPRLAHPIYFFLGDFADGQDPSRPQSVRLPLHIFPRDTITFTYPDSMASLPIGTHAENAAIRKPYHGQVFTLDEIREVIFEFGMPDKSSSAHDRFIEAQVWDVGPIREAQ